MNEAKKSEVHMTSAAAFVEGGIQDSCDDACSICLEEFCESDPSTVTNCKHEFHLQCILEWCQRSSECPMCLQSISLKDPTSHELFEAVERERKIRAAPSRNATIFHHPTLGDFELQHLPVGVSDSELEERIIQHLAAAAAMGRTRHFSRREGQRNRASSHGRPHFLVFSTHPGAQPSGHVSSSLTQIGAENEPAPVTVASPSTPLTSAMPANHQGFSFNNRSASNQSSLPNQDRAGPSEFQSFSESLKSRLNAVSMSSMSDPSSEVRREGNAGIATVSSVMEHLETRDNSGDNQVSVSNNMTDRSNVERSNQNNAAAHIESPLNEGSTPAACAASSAST
ncbi:ZINC FINGER RING/FYVE/PHD-TYPE [Salix koriyanagi]|uniref:RING-type E3 ubiquitin transferase n=1 Tax=Salix koriyanagi TaxID=2511006 RepID=A0A9Q0X410_9ROSI|nr:ZINC FINGER RING/FYVE/PHD-TYPE [Salix koriyanagi]